MLSISTNIKPVNQEALSIPSRVYQQDFKYTNLRYDSDFRKGFYSRKFPQ